MTCLSYSIDDLKSEMVYALCDELQSALPIKFLSLFSSMFYTCTFQNLDFGTRVGLDMFCTFEPVVTELEV